MKNYSYPVDESWSTQELIEVIELLQAVEAAYESSVSIAEFKEKYRKFKSIVTSKSQEKQIDKEFQGLSSYSIYKVVQEMKHLSDNKTQDKIKIR